MRATPVSFGPLGRKMEIPPDRADDQSLVEHAQNAVKLLVSGQLDLLARSFGYALAFGRPSAEAIGQDLAACLNSIGATQLGPSAGASISVKHFHRQTGLPSAVIECYLGSNSDREVLVELVVTEAQGKKHLSLEQISTAA